MKRSWHCIFIGVVSLFLCSISLAQRRGVAVAGPNGVNLPYMQPDNMGDQWMVEQGGMLQMQGNQPVISQGEMVTVNGNQGQMNGNNSAQLDPKTNELIVNVKCGQFNVTRRILISKDDGSVRYIDIFQSNRNQPTNINVQLQTWINFGVNSSTNVMDPKKQTPMGWAAMTGAGRAVAEVYAGKNSKVNPNINNQNGNNVVQSDYQLTIPANKQVALLHFVCLTGTQDQAQQFITNQNESKLMSSIPLEIRKIIVNYPLGTGLVGDYEVIRGDVLDVIELHNGDQLRGNLLAKSYKLTAAYGEVNLPSEQVIGIINMGQYKPRQLMVTADGQILGGSLSEPNVDLQLSNGETLHVPLGDISRIGYRKRAGEPEEWKFDKPVVTLRTGDRIEIAMPSGPIDIATRYGPLKIDPGVIAGISLQAEDSRVHEINLTDGSKFAGLVSAASFDMSLLTIPTAKPVRFPTSSILKIQFVPPVDVDSGHATMSLLNDDLLVGSLVGAIKLETAFDTIQLSGQEIRKLIHGNPGSADVQVELWDNTLVTGQLEDPILHCKLESGVAMDVPVALVTQYDQPLPTPAGPTVDKIKTLAQQLGDPNYATRETASQTLISLGPGVLSVLRDLRAAAPPEAQDGMDSVAKALGHADFKFSAATEPATQPAQ